MTNVGKLHRAVFLLVVFLFLSCHNVESLTKVSVINPDGREKTLLMGEELSRFERLWSAKTEKTPPSNLKWVYKLDVTAQSKEDRWLYDAAGWVQILSMKRTPVYKISSVEDFNQLLGIE
ncbi:MAG TPA: hypothetical protein VGH16_03865 [Candidatus Binatia bacterium]|jgi:hypothetical protein